MSAESRRHLTHRRTRFRSSTNNELGTVADELDLTQHVYPNKQPAAGTRVAADKTKVIEIRPAGFIGLGFAMLFLGLHQCFCTSPNAQPRQHRKGSHLLLFLTICCVAAQLIVGAQDRARVDGGLFGLVFHGVQSLAWMMIALHLQLDPAHDLLGADGSSGRQGSAGYQALPVAVSMLLMAAAFLCMACAVFARTARIPVLPLLAGQGLGLLCLSRAAFQMPHDAAEAVAMNRYGGVFLILSSFLAFRIALSALERRSTCGRAVLPTENHDFSNGSS